MVNDINHRAAAGGYIIGPTSTSSGRPFPSSANPNSEWLWEWAQARGLCGGPCPSSSSSGSWNRQFGQYPSWRGHGAHADASGGASWSQLQQRRPPVAARGGGSGTGGLFAFCVLGVYAGAVLWNKYKHHPSMKN